MSWIRLDDQIAHHPKTTRAGLSSWLWVCCIGYCQKFLTDGFIPYDAVNAIAAGIHSPRTHINKLLKIRLLDRAKGGYKVHDYLEFNDSRKVVLAKREADRVRKESERTQESVRPESVRTRESVRPESVRTPKLSARNPKNVLARAPAPHPIPSGSRSTS